MELYWLFGFLVCQRLAELLYARRNTRCLLAAGAYEVGAGHYPLVVAVHAAWLASLLIFIPPSSSLNLLYLFAFIILQAGRVWVISSLGRLWTTRIIVPADAPLVRRGPYLSLIHI